MNENQYKYQYLLSLQNVFTGIGIALARCAFNSVMFSAGRSDFSKAWAVSAISGRAFVCRRIGGITGKEEYKPPSARPGKKTADNNIPAVYNRSFPFIGSVSGAAGNCRRRYHAGGAVCFLRHYGCFVPACYIQNYQKRKAQAD